MKKIAKLLGFISILALFTVVITSIAMAAGDPSGSSYTTVTGKETLGDVATMASRAQLSANFVWVMITGFMVFFFQCGFAMVETGFCRAKNAAHTITMNFMVFLIGALGYFFVGFAIQFGGSGGAAGLGTGGALLD